MFLADLYKGDELLLNLLQFVGIFLVGVFQMLEGAAWVYIVARIDAHLLTIEGSDIGCMGGEMDIGHQWLGIAVSLQLGRDILHVLCLTGSLCRETHQFATSIDDALGLSHTGSGIVGIGGSHRLDADGVAASNADVAHMCFCRASSLITHGRISWSYTRISHRPGLCWLFRSSPADLLCRQPAAGQGLHR